MVGVAVVDLCSIPLQGCPCQLKLLWLNPVTPTCHLTCPVSPYRVIHVPTFCGTPAKQPWHTHLPCPCVPGWVSPPCMLRWLVPMFRCLATYHVQVLVMASCCALWWCPDTHLAHYVLYLYPPALSPGVPWWAAPVDSSWLVHWVCDEIGRRCGIHPTRE